MLPDEARAIMCKILFFVFAMLMLCLTKIRAQDKFSLSYVPSHFEQLILK
jgi:hypothetical protein